MKELIRDAIWVTYYVVLIGVCAAIFFSPFYFMWSENTWIPMLGFLVSWIPTTFIFKSGVVIQEEIDPTIT